MSSVPPRKWRADVRLAVEIFGKDHVARFMRVTSAAVDRWLTGVHVPDAASSLPNRLKTLLLEG